MTMELLLQDNEIHLHYIDGSLHLVQDGWTQPITTTRPQMIEFMHHSRKVQSLNIFQPKYPNDEVIFKRIIDNGKLKHAIELGGILGLLWDFCCPFIKEATSMPFCKA